ncbi:hypothetical protein MGG_11770 [Pyricularia oryzae 70-15]|uniref:Uncharacterized protein n=1 Tax=Pyricularia oryzae (strain 70-15 / ATCC MYA-4617 / FGSC 8958) TaxID=242507 RepID=G4MPQ8_PYRO7|nr:uncharacterized protein MGG_11770 [Pyricularia oryzae 70-15]EHA57205.1 hypothetical protein MGG_11770 [Pyricularia oryzae 70-15]KAI7920356.1 hypothetical protein M9X92_005897 [Pyricularia oryzae]
MSDTLRCEFLFWLASRISPCSLCSIGHVDNICTGPSFEDRGPGQVQPRGGETAVAALPPSQVAHSGSAIPIFIEHTAHAEPWRGMPSSGAIWVHAHHIRSQLRVSTQAGGKSCLSVFVLFRSRSGVAAALGESSKHSPSRNNVEGRLSPSPSLALPLTMY